MSNEFEESYSEPTPSETPEQPARRPRASKPRQKQSQRNLPPQLPWWIAGAAVVVAAAVGIYFGAIRSTSPTKAVKGSTQTSGKYKITYPKDWKTVAPNSVAPGQHAFAAMRQAKGHGVVVLRLGGKVAHLNTAYIRTLEAQLKKGAGPGYKLVGAHMISLKAGQALDVTYDRTKQHEVRNVVVLPIAKGSVVMATVAALGDAKTTREIDDIVSSFQLTS
ncbi:MAG TPA: hypothetical protein VFA37_08340 [Gaiellaceae bacterium]|nr:hypothetical protein [Gaiellaceae bacterium]